MADAGRPLPAFHEWPVPPAWQAIDFISDLHLSPALPRTLAAFEAHLLSTPAEAVFLLGDIFEVWVGDDARTQPFEGRCTELLAEAATRRQLCFMAGNRDFLLGSAMLRDTGVSGLPDPTVLDAWGQRVLLSHGDALCLADTEYQAFRASVRSAAWQREFLSLPLAERLRLAAEMRAKSDERRSAGMADGDIDIAEAVRWMHALGTPELVHGHTHRPGSDGLAPGYKRHVLSDWDLDDPAHPRAEVLRLTRSGFQRLAVA